MSKDFRGIKNGKKDKGPYSDKKGVKKSDEKKLEKKIKPKKSKY